MKARNFIQKFFHIIFQFHVKELLFSLSTFPQETLIYRVVPLIYRADGNRYLLLTLKPDFCTLMSVIPVQKQQSLLKAGDPDTEN